MTGTYRVLLLCGSLRVGSTNEAMLRTLQQIAPARVHTTWYAGLADLPHFNPDDDHDPLHPAVADMRARIEAADALIICTPEYAGALPGSFKNLLDWTVGGMEIGDKPTAWINVAGIAAPNGGMGAHDSLHAVLGFTGASIVEAACRRLPVARAVVGPDGVIEDESIRAEAADVLAIMIEHLESRAPGTA